MGAEQHRENEWWNPQGQVYQPNDGPPLTRWQMGYEEGQAALASRIEAVMRLISPDHITPIGRRQIDAVLQDRREVVPEREATEPTEETT